MKAGYIISAIGFFLSSFYFNVSGIRILPPFIGLLIFILGISKIRNFYSSSSSRAASVTLKINALVSCLGSVISLSRYSAETPLAFLLPALPYIYALSNILSAVCILFFFIQASEYFAKYSTLASMWKAVRVVVPTVYAVCRLIYAVGEIVPMGNYFSFISVVGPSVDLLVLVFMLIAAYSDHTAVAKEEAHTDK
ncbi:MAG: hypothetical protein IKV54_00815 [Clostridia bacterium]|nr:hypothetical protein [Clostridia bacterium]